MEPVTHATTCNILLWRVSPLKRLTSLASDRANNAKLICSVAKQLVKNIFGKYILEHVKHIRTSADV